MEIGSDGDAEMSSPWRVHVEACLVDSIGDVWTHQCQVLQRHGDAAVERRISRRLAISDGQFLLWC